MCEEYEWIGANYYIASHWKLTGGSLLFYSQYKMNRFLKVRAKETKVNEIQAKVNTMMSSMVIELGFFISLQ